jgi:uncharacterized iron-regulated membrane protein
MFDSARRTLVTTIGLMLLRRKLQRRGGPTAALALLGLEILRPKVLYARRVLTVVLVLTIVGGIVAAVIWWWRRTARNEPEPIPPTAPPSAPPASPAPAPVAEGA